MSPREQRLRAMKETWLSVFSDSGWKDEAENGNTVWHSASPFSATEHHVALTLATYMSPNGDSCFPSIPRLAAGSGRADSTIREALDQLVRFGFLERHRNRGRGRSNEYVAKIPEYFDWQASSEENRRRAAVFVSGHEQLSVGPAIKRVPEAGSETAEKTAGERRLSETDALAVDRRSPAEKPPEPGTETAGVRLQLDQDQSRDHPSSRSKPNSASSVARSERTATSTDEPAAASESAPVSIERAVAKLSTLTGWDTGSLNIVMPLLQQVPEIVFEEQLAKIAARRSVKNPPGLLVHLLNVATVDWRKSQHDARLATWDAFFGEAGLEKVKQEDPKRYVLAWATPALEAARPLPPNLVVSHILDFAFERYPDAANRAARDELLEAFMRACDRIPAIRSARDWTLQALDRKRIPLADVEAALTTLTEGSPDERATLIEFAHEIHANVAADERSVA